VLCCCFLTCVFWAEVAEKRAFFRWKWLKNMPFSGGSGSKTCVFQVEVAEKHAFNRCMWLKNVRFSGGSG
jgi:hypothetical protein